MGIYEIVGRLFVGGIVTFFTIDIGVTRGAPKSDELVKTLGYRPTMTPAWLLIFENVAIVTSGYFLFNGWWPFYIAIWPISALVLGYLTETIMWKLTTPEKIELWYRDRLKEKRQKEESERKEKEKLIAEMKEGIFKVIIAGDQRNIYHSYCYLWCPTGLRNPSRLSSIQINERGIDFGKLRCYRSKASVAASIGGFTPLGFITHILTTVDMAIFVPWSDFQICVFNTIDYKPYYIFFYRNSAKDRHEWLAVMLVHIEAKTIFYDTLARYQVVIKELSKDLIIY